MVDMALLVSVEKNLLSMVVLMVELVVKVALYSSDQKEIERLLSIIDFNNIIKVSEEKMAQDKIVQVVGEIIYF
jgi:hypothetical protein